MVNNQYTKRLEDIIKQMLQPFNEEIYRYDNDEAIVSIKVGNIHDDYNNVKRGIKNTK